VHIVHVGKNVNVIAWPLVGGGIFFEKRVEEILVHENNHEACISLILMDIICIAPLILMVVRR
jgi:hypothetical protein